MRALFCMPRIYMYSSVKHFLRPSAHYCREDPQLKGYARLPVPTALVITRGLTTAHLLTLPTVLKEFCKVFSSIKLIPRHFKKKMNVVLSRKYKLISAWTIEFC